MDSVFQTKRRALIVAGVLSLLLYGCASAAGPSESDVREVFEWYLRDGLSQGAIRIKSFQKTGGPVNTMGRLHLVPFRAEIECLKDYSDRYCERGCKQGTMVRVDEGPEGRKVFYGSGDDPSGTYTVTRSDLIGIKFTETYDRGGRLLRYEQKATFITLDFAKTWRGWRGANGKVY